MASRPIHWHEGMFLRPQHFQVADRNVREGLRDSEDWFHPFNWGVRSVEFDREAFGNYSAVLRSCEARFKDGTKISIPGDGTVDPVELRNALASAGSAMIYLAVPALQAGRANVEEVPTANGPRYWVDELEITDENTGSEEQALLVRRTRARLLLSTQDHTGYEVLPLARVERAAQFEAPPQLDVDYVPPLLVLDAWTPLWQMVQSLYHQIGAKVDQLAAQIVDRSISFDSQVPGDAERLLKLATLNGALSAFESIVFVRGLTPLVLFHELCRLVGQLAIFMDARRPPALPPYDHEDIGGCFYTVIKYIQLGLDTIAPSAFEKRYFEKNGERLQVSLEPGWLSSTKTLFLGVETELGDDDCEQLLRAMDMKLGSTSRVEQIFKQALRGLKLVPIVRPPRALPAGTGIVYYQIERDQVFWRDVADTCSMAIRMNLARATFQSDRILSVVPPKGSKTTNLQFALFII
ncbi:type VI secretion system protein ImpJ [Singulisphaera sp. GP187]|uniref:type VI secretion system baseplate subunit TssK n=1 Tax=Singulisphaera sp. GP187 TaxID=1882752 RepID=UPI0009260A2E|nr:type VI secretion system baseplate subunit TssK [Singulisphaera sp. GP187]SIO61695.1 type VI secretion system protein ImpJ [Singulisphaera sp. GP187]